MWVTVQDEDTPAICKRTANYQDHKIKSYVDMDRNSNLQRTRQQARRNEIQT